MAGIDPASQAVQIGTQVANTIAGIDDLNRRRRFEESLSLLTTQQQKELNDRLLSANTQNDRLKILSDSLVEYAIANDARTTKQDIWIYVVAGLIAMVMLGGALYYSTKKKSS